MQNNGRHLIKKSDFIIIGILLCVMVICFTLLRQSKNGAFAEIYLDNVLIKKISLKNDTIFNLYNINNEYPNMEICVKDGGIMITHSDCHDKICVHTGKINKKYQTIVCVPNKLVIQIVDNQNNNTESDIDAVM